MLEITKKENGSETELFLSGRLDTLTAPQLDAAVKEISPDAKRLVMDLTDLEYVSSAGLRVIIMAQRMMSKQGKLILRGCREEIMEIFRMTGFAQILNFA